MRQAHTTDIIPASAWQRQKRTTFLMAHTPLPASLTSLPSLATHTLFQSASGLIIAAICQAAWQFRQRKLRAVNWIPSLGNRKEVATAETAAYARLCGTDKWLAQTLNFKNEVSKERERESLSLRFLPLKLQW